MAVCTGCCDIRQLLGRLQGVVSGSCTVQLSLGIDRGRRLVTSGPGNLLFSAAEATRSGKSRPIMFSEPNCTQTEVSVKNYTEGTSIVERFAPKLKRAVWRSDALSRLKCELSHDQDTNVAAERILASFRISCRFC